MKKIIIIVFVLLIFSFELRAQIVDTIYVRAYQENLSTRFFNNHQNQLTINFIFNVEWELHGFKRSDFFFSYRSPKKEDLNVWSILIKEEKSFMLYKNYFTLEQFTKALNRKDFLLPIFNKKVQVIMLYGEKCSSKVEVYPVTIGTDLSSEG